MENIDDIILEPNPSRVMEGLRDTGYSFNTAIADLVDNSIAAYATVIKIKIQMDQEGNITLFIADNGCGMDMEGLKNAMRYGSDVRKEENSLGKFGLGLKTASTAFCRSLSLMSKERKDVPYKKVKWDLDEICSSNKWKLLVCDINEDELEILNEVTGNDHGTLVIWEKVDRLMKSYQRMKNANNALSKIIEKLKDHLSMIFQRFLDKKFDCQNIELYVNEEKLEPWDPFCQNEVKTELVANMPIKLELPTGGISKCYLKAYILPRVDEFSSPEAKNKSKISNDMQGFYVYRENRLIHYGDWLGMMINDPHINLLRISFSFDCKLDDAFNIDIKKSRIALNEDLFEYIKDNFLPAPKRVAQELYRKGRNKQIAKETEGAHQKSNNNIEDKAKDVEDSTIQIIDKERGDIIIKNGKGEFKTKISIINDNDDGNFRVVPVKSLNDGMLWEPTLVDGKHAVSINQSHDYYAKVYAPIIKNDNIIVGMDSLLWALSEAELSTCNENTRGQFEELRYHVSRILRKLVQDLPEPESSND